MPEGDSIRRIAADVRRYLLGRTLERVRTEGVAHASLAGRTVETVDAIGKHLVITLDSGTTIRSHLGMNGRWHRHPPGADPPHASLVLATDTDTLVCSRAMQVEILDRRDPRYRQATARLGPDILGDDFDPAAAVARARELPPETTVARALVDQRVAAGIGNIWRCEALFAQRTNPWTKLADVDDRALADLFARARILMQTNPRHAVHHRKGRPCPRCGAAIASRLDATEMRTVYYCPHCQQ